jgi:hypothetical protein
MSANTKNHFFLIKTLEPRSRAASPRSELSPPLSPRTDDTARSGKISASATIAYLRSSSSLSLLYHARDAPPLLCHAQAASPLLAAVPRPPPSLALHQHQRRRHRGSTMCAPDPTDPRVPTMRTSRATRQVATARR